MDGQYVQSKSEAQMLCNYVSRVNGNILYTGSTEGTALLLSASKTSAKLYFNCEICADLGKRYGFDNYQYELIDDWKERPIDLLVIDSDIKVYNDLAKYAPYVDYGGMMMVHGYAAGKRSQTYRSIHKFLVLHKSFTIADLRQSQCLIKKGR